MRWQRVAHGSRRWANFQRLAWKQLWRIVRPIRIEPIILPDPSEANHPSELCRCPCGPEAGWGAHFTGCQWARQMCRSCMGGGYCPACQGDGTSTNGKEGE